MILYAHKFRCGFEDRGGHLRFLKIVESVFPDSVDFVRAEEMGEGFSTLVAKKRRIAFIYGNEEVVKMKPILLSPDKHQWDRWFNKSTKKELKSCLETHRPYISGSSKELVVCQCILSPKPVMTMIGGFFSIIRALLCNLVTFSFVPQDLVSLASCSNGLAMDLISSQNRPNIILLDNVTSCPELIAKVIDLNR